MTSEKTDYIIHNTQRKSNFTTNKKIASIQHLLWEDSLDKFKQTNVMSGRWMIKSSILNCAFFLIKTLTHKIHKNEGRVEKTIVRLKLNIIDIWWRYDKYRVNTIKLLKLLYLSGNCSNFCTQKTSPATLGTMTD